MIVSSSAKLRSRVAREVPELLPALVAWKTVRTPHGARAVRAHVDRTRWPQGPSTITFFEHGDALECWSDQGARRKAIRIEVDRIIVTPLFSLSNPGDN